MEAEKNLRSTILSPTMQPYQGSTGISVNSHIASLVVLHLPPNLVATVLQGA